jgi:hypothetical protein
MLPRAPLNLALLFALTACDRRIADPPAVPLDADYQARTMDGVPLPVAVEERPGVTSAVTGLTVTLQADGYWYLHGNRRPDGAPAAPLGEFWDNGVYRFDGTTLLMHSNLTKRDWSGTVRGDTISVSAMMPIADEAHPIVLWP